MAKVLKKIEKVIPDISKDFTPVAIMFINIVIKLVMAVSLLFLICYTLNAKTKIILVLLLITLSFLAILIDKKRLFSS